MKGFGRDLLVNVIANLLAAVIGYYALVWAGVLQPAVVIDDAILVLASVGVITGDLVIVRSSRLPVKVRLGFALVTVVGFAGIYYLTFFSDVDLLRLMSSSAWLGDLWSVAFFVSFVDLATSRWTVPMVDRLLDRRARRLARERQLLRHRNNLRHMRRVRSVRHSKKPPARRPRALADRHVGPVEYVDRE